jgi:putative hemolysin
MFEYKFAIKRMQNTTAKENLTRKHHLFCQNIPEGELADKRYIVRFVRNAEELDAVLKLRFEVFNLELGEGLESSFLTRRDLDEFDDVCHHLIVIERVTGKIIGTYRMQTFEMARARGFYTGTEFDLSQMPEEIIENAVELGRACIAKTHRNGRVLFLLWRGLAMYMSFHHKRFLFGCCSLTSQDPVEGKAVMSNLVENGHVRPDLDIQPLPDFACYDENVKFEKHFQVKIPRLFRIYLDYGAKVCGPPAIDRRFKTIDYLVLLDLATLDRKTYMMFFLRKKE